MVMKRSLALVSAAAVFFSVLAGTAQALVIELVPADPTVSQGDTIEVDVVISGLDAGAPPSLGTFDLDLVFDPSILVPTAVTFGPFLGDPLVLEAITGFAVLPGLLDFFETSLLLPAELDALQPDSFPLATVSFTAAGPGSTSLIFSELILGDAFGDPLSATPSAGSVTVTPAPIPVPGTLFLLAPGLLMLVLRRRLSVTGTSSCPPPEDAFPARPVPPPCDVGSSGP
jgi:hypothetical protein